jgi:hypothetical protein
MVLVDTLSRDTIPLTDVKFTYFDSHDLLYSKKDLLISSIDKLYYLSGLTAKFMHPVKFSKY